MCDPASVPPPPWKVPGSADAQVHVLGGPTASGKTALALAWAAVEPRVEIVSADALLFYRGMDIGTAKPTPAELERVRHHLIDVSPVTDPWDVGRYTQAAAEAVADILSRGGIPLVVGGSGFYLKSYFGPVVDGLKVPDSVREEVRALESAGGLTGLLDRLLALDPAPPPSLDQRNPRRVARALERLLAAGRPLAQLEEEFRAAPYPFSRYKVSFRTVDQPDAALRERIALRTRAMLEAGFVDEVRHLIPQGLRSNPGAATAVGYREVLAFLDGTLPGAALEEGIAQGTWRLVRKQRAWLRGQMGVAGGGVEKGL